jgi:hypothetical protein
LLSDTDGMACALRGGMPATHRWLLRAFLLAVSACASSPGSSAAPDDGATADSPGAADEWKASSDAALEDRTVQRPDATAVDDGALGDENRPGSDAAQLQPDVGADRASMTDGGGVADAAPADGTTIATCPAAPPADGSACPGDPNQTVECDYLDCSQYGELLVLGYGGTWHVSSRTPCPVDAGPPCHVGFMACAPDQICQVTTGGAASATCVPNTCKPGLLSCDCITCNYPCVITGFNVSCQRTCPPPGGCP